MRFFLKSLAALAIGTALGLLATWLSVGRGFGGDVRNGPWRTSLHTGSAQGGPYLRAAVALHGLLALNRSETVYYTAGTDSAGAPLDGRCVYAIEGRDPPARWWSITAYGSDDYLIPNPAGLYSVSKNSIARRGDGSFVARVRRNANSAGEIASGDGAFSLTLRLYNPAPAAAADPAGAALPRIVKESCA